MFPDGWPWVRTGLSERWYYLLTQTVTGGGTGLGLVTATTLADNGCKVYITGRREQPLQEAVEAYKARKSSGGAGGEIIAIQADVSTKDGITRAHRCGQFEIRGPVMLTRAGFKKEIEAREQFINVLINSEMTLEEKP